MALDLKPVTAEFAAEVDGIDIAAGVSDADFRALADALDRYAVLVLHGQRVTDEEQVAFSKRFGPLETSIRKNRARGATLPEVSDISNVDAQGRLIPADDERVRYHHGNQMWHTDSSFKQVPAMASLLSGREVPPEGGETEFADMRAAYDALPADRQRSLEDKVAEHSIIYSRRLMGYEEFTPEERALTPPVQQAVVRKHPGSGRKSLYVASHASHIIGMPVEEGRKLLGDLLAFAVQPQFVYRHRWRQHDLVIWDNRCVLHRGLAFDETRYRRVMHRTTVAGKGPTAADGRVIPEAADAT